MLKRILAISIISILWCSSIAFAYVFGGSNLSLSMYPEFNSYLPYNPSKYEIELYVEEANIICRKTRWANSRNCY